MKQESLVVAKPKRRRYGSYLGEISPAPENLVNRDFQAAAPNEKWLTDITEFQIPNGKAYLSCENRSSAGSRHFHEVNEESRRDLSRNQPSLVHRSTIFEGPSHKLQTRSLFAVLTYRLFPI
jgi:hypothetical protein